MPVLHYTDILLLTLLVPVGAGVTLVALGARRGSKLGVWYGIAHVLVLTPLVINEFPYGWKPSIAAGHALVIAFAILWAAAWFTKSVRIIAIGATGVAGFAAHIFVLANSP